MIPSLNKLFQRTEKDSILANTLGGQFSSVAQLCLTLCNPMDCSMPGFLVLHHLPEFAQTHVHWVGDAIQPSDPLSSPSPPAFNLSQHQVLSERVSTSHHVAKVLELQLQLQAFQKIFGVDSFRIDQFDLAVEGTVKSLFQHHSLKASGLWRSAFLMVQLSHPYVTTGKTTALTIRHVSLFSNREVVSLCAMALAAGPGPCYHVQIVHILSWGHCGNELFREEMSVECTGRSK